MYGLHLLSGNTKILFYKTKNIIFPLLGPKIFPDLINFEPNPYMEWFYTTQKGKFVDSFSGKKISNILSLH